MTKAEEMRLVDQIEELIDTAGDDSYIHMTFAGVCDVCRNNIVNDFGNSPVHDLNDLREEHDVMRRKYHEMERDFSGTMQELEDVNYMNDELIAEANDAGEMYCKLEEECAQKDAEIVRLKAEIVRMRISLMTDKGYAELYDAVQRAE